MTRILYIDSVGGLAGDMFLGAALDAGFVTLPELQSIVTRWLPEPVLLVSGEVMRNGMRARSLHVVVGAGTRREPRHAHEPDEASDHQHDHDREHEHDQDHDHDRSHLHEHHHAHDHGHHDHASHGHGDAPRRNLADVERLLDLCPIPATAVERARAMFRALAEAESEAHGVPVADVHFHEVGATDSLVDFALGAYVIDRLGVAIEASPAIVGRGYIRMEHGLWPVPPPGTASILQTGGIPLRAVPSSMPWENVELTTPTGACLLRLARRFGEMPAGRVVATGTGAGTLDPPGYANVVRLFLVERDEAMDALVSADLESARFDTDEIAVLETWIDDLPGNLLSLAMDEVLAAGAVDVAVSSASFKKGRMGYRVEVLAPPHRAHDVAGVLLGRTTSIGLRVRTERRWKLFRRPVTTADGLAGKLVHDATGEISRVAPETDALARLATDGGPAPMLGWRVEGSDTKKGG